MLRETTRADSPELRVPAPTYEQPPAIILLDDLHPLVEAIHLTEHVQRPDTSGNGRSGRSYPAPVNDSVIAAQHDARRTLAGLYVRLRGTLGLSAMDEDISRLFALPCPHCRGMSLRYRVALEEVYCLDVSCRDEHGTRRTWPKTWLTQLGRMSAEDDDRKLTTTERLRARILDLEARNARLESDVLRLRALTPQAC